MPVGHPSFERVQKHRRVGLNMTSYLDSENVTTKISTEVAAPTTFVSTTSQPSFHVQGKLVHFDLTYPLIPH